MRILNLKAPDNNNKDEEEDKGEITIRHSIFNKPLVVDRQWQLRPRRPRLQERLTVPLTGLQDNRNKPVKQTVNPVRNKDPKTDSP